MTGRRLEAGCYGFDQIEIGDWIQTDTAMVTAKAIDVFADLTGDRFEIHMDDAAARDKGFAGRVAHGLLVLSLVDGLKNQAEAQFDAVASLGWDWTFSRPVSIGDVISAQIHIIGKRLTRDTRRGILTLEFRVTNQNDQIVQRGQNQLMVHRR